MQFHLSKKATENSIGFLQAWRNYNQGQKSWEEWVGHEARIDALLCAPAKCEFMGVL